MKRSVLLLSFPLVGFLLLAQEQPARPSITGIAYARLWSANKQKSVDYYHRILGLTPRDAGCPGLMRPCFVINEHQQLVLTEERASAPANLLVEIAFSTPDLASMRRYLQKRGIAVDIAQRDFNGTEHFSIRDPEGHAVAFVQAPQHRPYAAPAEQVAARLIHAGLIVKDRANEDRFYQDLLGFHVYWHGGMKDGAADDWVAMQVPDGADWVEYMLHVSPNADKQELGVMNHIALGVTDIQAAKAQLLKNGWKPGEEPQMGRDGKWQLNVYDPDLTRLEFMEFTPVQKPCCSEFAGPHPKP